MNGPCPEAPSLTLLSEPTLALLSGWVRPHQSSTLAVLATHHKPLGNYLISVKPRIQEAGVFVNITLSVSEKKYVISINVAKVVL